ncbi:MAG: redox-regulated ATPase YchF [Clostridia bacterium]|nr:redox-regulated ATPase YchF [Clostridia bacterium]
MRIGLVGRPLAGKSTLFHLLTGLPPRPPGSREAEVGTAAVPDPRLPALAALFRPRKVTPGTLEVVDAPGLRPGGGSGEDGPRREDFFETVRRTDALLVVLALHPAAGGPEGPDPVGELRGIEEELLLADLERVERIAARLRKNHRRSAEEERTLALLTRCEEALGEERPIRSLGLAPEESQLLRGFALLSEKPLVVAPNVAEADVREGEVRVPEALAADCRERGLPLVPFCGPLEAEIARLPADEREAFLSAYGLSEPGVARVARAAQAALGLIAFLTVGEDEVRAWPVPRGTRAHEAAGRIHSDIQRGFIRAEVVPWQELVRLGSLKACREAGVLRLEGRDYVVADGDVIHFRFHV